MDQLLAFFLKCQNLEVSSDWVRSARNKLRLAGTVEALGNWEHPNADTLVWRAGTELTQAINAPIVWTSEARYDDNDLYIGRTPELRIHNSIATVEDAMTMGELLHRGSVWIP